MTGIAFDFPTTLALLLLFLPLAVAGRLSPRRKRVAAGLPLDLGHRLALSRFLSGLAFAFLVVALAGPRWGEAEPEAEYRRSADIVFALDLSLSMEVADGLGGLNPNEPTRLARGLALTREAVELLPGTRFAAAVSRGRGVLALPLTWDSASLLAFLTAMESRGMTGRGTNLQSLVEAAATAFSPTSPARRIIVLISDGEELSGSLRGAAERCRQEGIAIVALALGSESGGTFPGGGQTRSVRRSQPMLAAATLTSGLYLDGGETDAGARLAAFLDSGRQPAGGSPFDETRQRWPLFALFSLAAFLGSRSCLLGKRKRKESE